MVDVACPDLGVLEEYAAQMIDRASASRIELHLESCATCRELLFEVSRNASLEQRLDRAGGRLREIESGDLPDRIGDFRVVRELGRGGMGVVLLAEQDAPRRLVALKVMHPFSGTQQAIARFQLEVETLGRLRHPAVAAIHEAGAASVRGERVSYYAMEYVEGATLGAHLSTHDVPLDQRLAWFISIAEAIRAAHRIGVLHRDIKPTNVLVSDSDAAVKVIDFGLARELTGDATLTRTGMVVGTLAYMAPEQADNAAVDTRTDVYGLGALLYYLFTGAAPIPVRDCGLKEALRRIHEQDPAPPSATMRGLEPPLDWITLRALEKEPDARYPSVDALIADVQAFLADEPVAAAPRSWQYRARLLVRRHRVEVIAASVLFVGLLTALVVTTRSLTKEAKARADAGEQARQAQQQATIATRVRELFVSVFDQADPAMAPGEALTPLELVKRGAEAVMREDGDIAEVQATVRVDLARVLRALGDIDEAERLLRSALTIYESLEHASPASVYECQEQLGLTLVYQGMGGEAVSLLEPAVDGLRVEYGSQDLRLADPLASLGQAYLLEQRDLDAERAFMESWALEQEHAAGDEATSVPDLPVAWLAFERGDLGNAIHVARAAIDRRERQGVGTTEIPYARALLGLMLLKRGDLEAAGVALERAVEELSQIYGEAHPRRLQAQEFLAEHRVATGDLEGAEALLRGALELSRDERGSPTAATWSVMSKLGAVLGIKGALDEALPLLVDAEAGLRGRGPRDRTLATARLEQGTVLVKLRRCQEAIDCLEPALASWRESPGASLRFAPRFAHQLGRAHLLMGRFEEARAVLERHVDAVGAGDLEFSLAYVAELSWSQLMTGDVEAMRATLLPLAARAESCPDELEAAQEFRQYLAFAHQRAGEPGPAIPLLERLVSGRRTTHGPNHERTVKAENALAICLGEVGRDAEAEERFLGSIEHARIGLGADADDVGYFRKRFAEFLMARDRVGDARAVLRTAVAEIHPAAPTRGELLELLAQLEESGGASDG